MSQVGAVSLHDRFEQAKRNCDTSWQSGVEPLEYSVSYILSHCWGEAEASEGLEQVKASALRPRRFELRHRNHSRPRRPYRFGAILGH
jgi:hypothetical protein